MGDAGGGDGVASSKERRLQLGRHARPGAGHPRPVLFAQLEHDPEKWRPFFPRDKREAFARRSCVDGRDEPGHDEGSRRCA